MSDYPTDYSWSDAGRPNSAPGLTYELDDAERPSEAVVRAVAALTNATVLDLDPLYDVVDPEHLDGLFDEAGDGGVFEERSVTFQFNGCRVSVTDEAVVVRRVTDPPGERR